MLDLLDELVDASIVVVPFSDQLAKEICHQADPQTRRATAEVIDRLTTGVTILGWRKRKVQEIFHWVAALLEVQSPVPLDGVWASLYEAFGLLDFEPTWPDKELAAAFLKAVEDLADHVGFRGIVDRFVYDSTIVEGWRALADELTGYKSTIWNAQGTFDEIFQEEALAYLDRALADPTPELLETLRRLPHGKDLEGKWIIANAKRAFIACENLALHPTSLPSLRVIAGGHSRIRFDRNRRFKPGDGADLFHAATAIPYCNVFITDRSMRHLLTTPPTDFTKLYGCAILGSVDEAVQYLREVRLRVKTG
jgi:hypothetical protein